MDKKNLVKHYTNGEVTVVWKSALCFHSGNCVRGMREVFNPTNRPWINLENNTSENIEKQVFKCPSGALTCFWNKDQKNSIMFKAE